VYSVLKFRNQKRKKLSFYYRHWNESELESASAKPVHIKTFSLYTSLTRCYPRLIEVKKKKRNIYTKMIRHYVLQIWDSDSEKCMIRTSVMEQVSCALSERNQVILTVCSENNSLEKIGFQGTLGKYCR